MPGTVGARCLAKNNHSHRSSLSANLILMLLAACAALQLSARCLSAFDFGVIAFGFAAASLIYASANTLAQNHITARELGL